MREDRGFSRNRHFLALSSPEGRRAVRIARHLRSIEHDLELGWPARAERREGRILLTVAYRSGTRAAWLTGAEYRMLLSNPAARDALGVNEASPGSG
jgi:PAS domain-containing protein